MRIVTIIIVLLLLQIYGYQAVKSLTSKKGLWGLYWLISLGIHFNFFLRLFLRDGPLVLQGAQAYAMGFLLALLSAQMVMTVFMFLEDIVRIFRAVFQYFSGRKQASHPEFLPSRRSFIAKTALAIAAIPFTSLLFGMYKGKYNYKVLSYELEFEDLPEAFDGYQITQISDIHCGSFDNKEKIAYGVDLIKAQKSDLICFTGDLINTLATELEDWKDLFSTLSAPDGVLSVLGNHDYGEYYPWKDEESKKENLQKLKDTQKEMGWDLLLNENRTIEREGQKIHVVGVENWGKGNFPKYGDEEKAAGNLKKEDFKILMSHDPSHWALKIQEDPRNYHLTLSGHTHGMQFGIEIPGWIKWSPIKYRYKYWAGLYEHQGRFINVNRGFGYLAYPGRVGIWPEITVITLRKKK